MPKQKIEEDKLIWMKEEFVKECKRMLDLIDKQELKVNQEKCQDKR